MKRDRIGCPPITALDLSASHLSLTLCLSVSRYDINNRVLNLILFLNLCQHASVQRPARRCIGVHAPDQLLSVTRTRPSRHAIFMWLLLQPCRAPLRASHVAQFLSPHT